MTTRENDADCRMGFLTAIEVPERGYVGGLLVTNRFGRPLEFQCTTPVKPNRTQEILYGPTLVPWVLGELIGRTLLEKVGVKPHFVLTETPEILEVRNHVGLPVACIEAARAKVPSKEVVSDVLTTNERNSEPAEQIDESQDSADAEVALNPRATNQKKFRFHAAHLADQTEVESRIASLPREIDLHEPFERVREALEETARAGTMR